MKNCSLEMHEKQIGNETKHHLQWECSLGWYCDDEIYWSYCWSAYLLIHSCHNPVFANITAIGMTDCPAYGKTTQHQQDDYEYLTVRQSGSHQDEGHSLNNSQSDAYKNWFFFIVFAQSEIPTLYHDDKTNDHVSTTNIIHQYVYYNMNYCIVC